MAAGECFSLCFVVLRRFVIYVVGCPDFPGVVSMGSLGCGMKARFKD